MADRSGSCGRFQVLPPEVILANGDTWESLTAQPPCLRALDAPALPTDQVVATFPLMSLLSLFRCPLLLLSHLYGFLLTALPQCITRPRIPISGSVSGDLT